MEDMEIILLLHIQTEHKLYMLTIAGILFMRVVVLMLAGLTTIDNMLFL